MIFPRPTLRQANGCLSFQRLGRGGRPCEDNRQFQDEYRKIDYECEKWAAHRLSFHLNCSEIPRQPPYRGEGNILHTCDNKWCIEPSHLYIGTAKQNAIDNAMRNAKWRENRSIAQKKIGFPKVSPEGRKRMAEANRERMLRTWKEKPESVGRKRKI